MSPPEQSDDRRDIAVDLLRLLDPDRLLLYGGRRPDAAAWERHRRQRSEYVLVATSAIGSQRLVLGTLECRVLAGADAGQGMLDRLYVEPRFRRHGIASRLLGAAIVLARERGLVALREHIPNVLVRDPDTGRWHPHLPTGEGWGGLRSLGATVNACHRAGMDRPVARAIRRDRAVQGSAASIAPSIGAALVLPLARVAPEAGPTRRFVASRSVLFQRLLADLAVSAGVQLGNRADAADAA